MQPLDRSSTWTAHLCAKYHLYVFALGRMGVVTPRTAPGGVPVLVWLSQPVPDNARLAWRLHECLQSHNTLYFNSNNASLRGVASLRALASTVVHVPLCMRDEHRPSVGVSCAGTLVIIRCHRCTFSCKVLSPPARVDATRVTHFGWLCPVMSG